MIYEATIERDDVEIKLDIEYTYYKGCRGARDSLCGKAGAGPQLEPDDEPEIEILSVKDENGLEFELTKQEDEEIEQKLWGELEIDNRY